MEIKWFEQAPRGAESVKVKKCTITFSEKPLGVRLNAPLLKGLRNDGVEFVKLGVLGDNTFVLSPSTKEDGGLRVSGGAKASAGFISSSTVGHWAREQGHLKVKVEGEYHEESKTYRFKFGE